MSCVTFDREFSSQVAAVQDALQVKSKFQDVALQVLELRCIFWKDVARYSQAIRPLNARWLVVEFVQASSPANAGLDSLKSLYSLSSKVYLAASHALGAEYEDELEKLASELYRLLDIIQNLEAQPSNALRYAGAAGAAALAGAAAPVAAPVAAAAVLTLSWLRRVTSVPLFYDRPREKPIEFTSLHDNARFCFEPRSSGLARRVLTDSPSKTIGQLDIDVAIDEGFRCYFDLSAKHKIAPSDVQRLHTAMLRAFKEQRADQNRYLAILAAIDEKFLDDDLRLCLTRIKVLCNRLKGAPPATRQVALKVVDVPTYKNSCGLFALALHAHRLKKMPEDLLYEDEASFTRSNKDLRSLDMIHTRLRKELTDAIKENLVAQGNIRERFRMACLLAVTSDCPLLDMGSFLTSNATFINDIKKADRKRFQLKAEELPRYKDMVQNDKAALTPRDTAAMQNRITAYFAEHTLPSEREHVKDFKEIIEDFARDEKDPLIRIIKQRKLALIGWLCGPTQEMRTWWQKEALTWLEGKAVDFLRASQDQASIYGLFAVLLNMNIGPNGRDLSFSPDAELCGSTLDLYIVLEINRRWPELFINYVNHLQNQPCMLIHEELNILSETWGLEIVSISPNATHVSTHPSTRGFTKIYLTNPTYDHWMAVFIQ